MHSLKRRRLLSRVMTILTTSSAALVILALVLIIGYIAVTGVKELNLGFLINDPKPIGAPGSGIANAIGGSVIMIAIASVIGLPVGIMAGLCLAEFSSDRFGTILRFLIDTLT